MPSRPLSKCSQPGCPNRTSGAGRCDEHRRQADRDAKARQVWRVYNDPRWEPLRQRVLLEQPVCTTEGCVNPSSLVDHKTPVRVAPALAFYRRNLQGLCQPCHSRKTAAENGFGGRPE